MWVRFIGSIDDTTATVSDVILFARSGGGMQYFLYAGSCKFVVDRLTVFTFHTKEVVPYQWETRFGKTFPADTREDIEMGNGDFDRIIRNLHPSLSLDQDQKLKRAPVGFDAEGPYIDYIKLKNFCLSADLDDNNLDIGRICDVFRSAKPFLDYINRAIEFTREDNL